MTVCGSRSLATFRLWRNPRRTSATRPLRAAAAFLLATYLIGVLGVIPPPPKQVAASVPFPCEHHNCGCRSAEQCWTVCRCFTHAERLVWAARQRITPPELAMVVECGDNAPHGCRPSGSCCEPTPPRSCCSTAVAATCPATPAAPETEDAPFPLGPSWNSLKCSGVDNWLIVSPLCLVAIATTPSSGLVPPFDLVPPRSELTPQYGPDTATPPPRA